MTDNKLNDLCENLWEGLNGEIKSVGNLSENQISIKFSCDDWNKNDFERNFEIICSGVSSSNLVPVQCDEIELSSDHVLLWEHNLLHCNLFYNSAPKNAHEILGLLCEAHERALGDFSELYNSVSAINFLSHCDGGYGLLARGPEPLLESYQSAISDKIRSNITKSYKPDGGFSVLFFDDFYVIAKSFEIIEAGE